MHYCPDKQLTNNLRNVRQYLETAQRELRTALHHKAPFDSCPQVLDATEEMLEQVMDVQEMVNQVSKSDWSESDFCRDLARPLGKPLMVGVPGSVQQTWFDNLHACRTYLTRIARCMFDLSSGQWQKKKRRVVRELLAIQQLAEGLCTQAKRSHSQSTPAKCGTLSQNGYLDLPYDPLAWDLGLGIDLKD